MTKSLNFWVILKPQWVAVHSYLVGKMQQETLKIMAANLGVVTLNIPRIAIESNGDMAKFWELFDQKCN